MKISLLLLSACTLTHATIYTWTGSAADGDWSNSANWDGGVVAPTDFISGTNLEPDTIVFDGASMPTSNLGAFTISPSSIIASQVLFQFNSGGSYTLDYTGAYDSGPIYTASARNFITVGDGIGLAADVTVTLSNYNSLLRHNSQAHTIVVNSDGILNLEAVSTYVNTGRSSNFLINGGSVVASSFIHTSYGHDNNGNVIPAFIMFAEEGSSFTAAYGSQFTDLTAVEADAQNIFRSSLGYGGFEYTDNGSSFTITLVPEPSAITLLGLGGLALVTRRKR